MSELAWRRWARTGPTVAIRPLAGRELRVGNGIGQVGGRCLGREADHGAVDVDPLGAVGRAAGAGDQVGPGRGEVKDLHLVDLALVESFLDRLVRPLAELRVPQ